MPGLAGTSACCARAAGPRPPPPARLPLPPPRRRQRPARLAEPRRGLPAPGRGAMRLGLGLLSLRKPGPDACTETLEAASRCGAAPGKPWRRGIPGVHPLEGSPSRRGINHEFTGASGLPQPSVVLQKGAGWREDATAAEARAQCNVLCRLTGESSLPLRIALMVGNGSET